MLQLHYATRAVVNVDRLNNLAVKRLFVIDKFSCTKPSGVSLFATSPFAKHFAFNALQN